MFTNHHRGSLKADGYVFIASLMPGTSTIECGKKLGNIYTYSDIEKKTPKHLVDTLYPREEDKLKENTYSGLFGYNEFPFHTDLAHSSLPPRYLILRCINGCIDVQTRTLSLNKITERFNFNKLKKCITYPRKRVLDRKVTPLPIIFKSNFIRWDSVFLKAANKHAGDFHQWMSEKKWDGSEISHTLLNKGDTLIIDNWTTLHSRSSVSKNNSSRIIERLYLSEIWK